VLLLDKCLLLYAHVSLSTQSGNFWIHPRMFFERNALTSELATHSIQYRQRLTSSEKCNPGASLLGEHWTSGCWVRKHEISMTSHAGSANINPCFKSLLRLAQKGSFRRTRQVGKNSVIYHW